MNAKHLLWGLAAASLLDPQPGERVLDMCAAPGGKTGTTTRISSRAPAPGDRELSRCQCRDRRRWCTFRLRERPGGGGHGRPLREAWLSSTVT
jgi:hypothetical protein